MSSTIQTALDAINAAQGFDLAFAGLTITFTALGTIATCIALLPKLLKVLNKIYPEKVNAPKAKSTPQNGISDDVAAAIGLAYHSLKSGK